MTTTTLLQKHAAKLDAGAARLERRLAALTERARAGELRTAISKMAGAINRADKLGEYDAGQLVDALAGGDASAVAKAITEATTPGNPADQARAVLMKAALAGDEVALAWLGMQQDQTAVALAKSDQTEEDYEAERQRQFDYLAAEHRRIMR